MVHMLVSFWHYGKRDLRALASATSLPVGYFADSGAYSAYTLRKGGEGVKLADYAAWLKDHQDLLSVMANLDVIGDPRATARNQVKLEEQGLPVLPIWHGTSPLAELEALCRDYGYVAMGGTAALHGRRKPLLALTAKAALTAREHGTVLHGFGRSATEDLASVPFYSADSSTWAYGPSWGGFQFFTGRGVSHMKIAEAARHPTLLRSHGVDPALVDSAHFGLLRDRRDYRKFKQEQRAGYYSSAVAWLRFEKWLRARHQVPPPPGQAETGTVFYFADNVLDHMRWMMEAAEWLAGGEEKRDDTSRVGAGAARRRGSAAAGTAR